MNAESASLTWSISRAQNPFQEILDWTTIWPFLFISRRLSSSRGAESLKMLQLRSSWVSNDCQLTGQTAVILPVHLLYSLSVPDLCSSFEHYCKKEKIYFRQVHFSIWLYYLPIASAINMATRWRLKLLKKGFMK